MGSKFNSLFGSYSKLYDQPSYKPVPFTESREYNDNMLGFTSEEGRNSILNCPFGFNYKFMNSREFQRYVLLVNHLFQYYKQILSDGDWWMNSDPSITFNKQKMFNMYDSASLETYFGSKNINPYLKNEPKEALKEEENYIVNPSMFAHCTDTFVGTPVQDETGQRLKHSRRKRFH